MQTSHALCLIGGLVFVCGCANESGSPQTSSSQASPTSSQTRVTPTAEHDSPPAQPHLQDRSTSERVDSRLKTPQSPLTLLGPYGTLNWSDTLLSALRKVRRIEGASDVELLLLHRNLPAADFDGPGKLHAWMKSIFGQTMTYRTEYIHNDPSLPRPVYAIGAKLEAKSLSLVGVDYSLRVTFTSERGLVVTNPEQVQRQSAEFFGEEFTDDVPLVLSEVELSPIGLVSPEAHREIIDLLMEKYGPLRVETDYALDFDQIYLNLTFRDAEENSIDLYPGGKLTYRNGLVHGEHKLADIYEEHRNTFSETERKSRARGRPDAGNDL